MILTFTANPSIDRTIALAEPLARGQVQRAYSAMEQAAGKGVNVATVLVHSQVPAVALVSFTDRHYEDLFALHAPDDLALAHVASDQPYLVRVNATITEDDGTTTKVNESGPRFSAAHVAAVTDELICRSQEADWVVLSGSTPPGCDNWYAQIAQRLSGSGCKLAIDTSGAALDAVIAALPGAGEVGASADGADTTPATPATDPTPATPGPDALCHLMKPNSDELAYLTGTDAEVLEAGAARGDYDAIVDAAGVLHRRGVENVLVSLGAAGAVLVNARGAWAGTPPPTHVKSTVGAGDSSVAGFLIAQVRGLDDPACLAHAIAYGSAAASLPGTTLPTPDDLKLDQVQVRHLAA